MSLGRRIALMRGFRTMTQEQLGAMVCVSKPTVSNWENDHRTQKRPPARCGRGAYSYLALTYSHLRPLRGQNRSLT